MADMTGSIASFGLAAHSVTASNLKSHFTKPSASPMYFLMSPETLRMKEAKMLLKAYNFDLVAVDEGHTTFEWGSTFRKDYTSLYEVRSFIDCPMAVYTATLTPSILNEVKRLTGIRANQMETIAVTPDRKNIFLETRGSTLVLENLRFLVDEVRASGNACAKTIVFVQTRNKATELFAWFHGELQELGIYASDGVAQGFTVDMYTSATEIVAKDKILEEFKKPNSRLRVLVATIAFGLGVDIPDVRRIIIWGQPNSPMALWQEIGRAGRDGGQGRAIIFPQRSNIGTGMHSDFVLPKDSCTRNYILNQFYGSAASGIDSADEYQCCSFCNLHSAPEAMDCTNAADTPHRSQMQKILNLLAPASLCKRK